MKLSTRSRYGLRLMIVLARGYGTGPRLLKEIADGEELSEKYLGQLVIPLKSAGYLNSVRGSRGGYELAVDPSEITPLDVVNLLEGDFLTDETAAPGCSGTLRVSAGLWDRLQQAFVQVLSSVTLAELAEKSLQEEKQSPMYSI